MPIEIERKFLVHKDKWNKVEKKDKSNFRQGYILSEPSKTIRVRLTDDKAYLTIKGMTIGASRPEYEYEIPQEEAKELLDNFCESELSKVRYRILYHGKLWEVDEFFGKNAGLIIAEIELTTESETFDIPDWVAEEVTGDKKYSNSNLAKLS